MLVAARKTTTPARDPGAARFSVPIETSPDLWQTRFDLCEALNALVADAFALYLKTKNFQWHVSGPHPRSLPALRRAGGADSRNDGRDRRARPEERCLHVAIHRSR